MNILYARCILLAVLIALSLPSSSIAQPIEKSSKGKDFWLTFLPNLHVNNRLSDSLFVYIVADVPTSGNISYRNKAGIIRQQPFQIIDPTKVFLFPIWYDTYELEGYQQGRNRFETLSQSEDIALQYFHVVADQDIGVYALSQAQTTSDAFLVLPTKVLGNDYYVMAYNSNGDANGNAVNVGSSTPSQFAVLATENNTTITVTPKTATYNNDLTPQTITLNQGETYLVQAKITVQNLSSDLTGSHVTSTKPVAVFGGQQRAIVPVELADSLISRDCLIEQVPPVGTWGKNAFLTPYPLPTGATRLGQDMYRILAAYDSTKVFIDGNFIGSYINSGGVYSGELIKGQTITANKPILVAHLKKTASDVSMPPGSIELSDPFMLIIPPKEQFLKSYRCYNVQAHDFQNPNDVYVEQYITVVAPTSTLSTIRLDGNPVNVSKFIPIPPSNEFSYAWLGGANGADGVTDGAHTISADEPIGIYIYGYGRANSYGYVGGTGYRVFDFNPPNIIASNDCFAAKGIIFDTLTGDTHIKQVTAPADSMKNVTATIAPFSPVAPSVTFTAQLNDIYNDGAFTVFAVDSVDYISEKTIEIPGFTVGLTQPRGADSLLHAKRIGPVNKKYCFDIELYNYGKFPQQITSLGFSKTSPEFSINSAAPIILNPKEKKTINVCFNSVVEGEFLDTLFIGQACGTRQLVELQMSALIDRNKPTISLAGDPCQFNFKVTITDSLSSDLGIQTTEILQDSTINCVVTADSTNDFRVSGYSIAVVDYFQDASYAIRATDSAGNFSIRSESIPGFTLKVESVSDTTPFRYDSTIAGDVRCEGLEMYNYGKFPLTFNEIYVAQNILFSLPQSQLPFVLQPKERRKLSVCYNPKLVQSIEDTDTLEFRFGCLAMRAALAGTAKEGLILALGDTRCKVPVRLSSIVAPVVAFLQQNAPNPLSVHGETSISFGIENTAETTLEIFDMLGNKRAVIVDGNYTSGVYEVTVSDLNLPTGMYVYRLHSGKTAMSKIMMIAD
ncbi:MAG: T9SS type A sorting domain-containing protein [Ignavibacteria bacterium]|nr:T9SS type A sorting domain-containing protein [Ignavibacteria bacterium]